MQKTVTVDMLAEFAAAWNRHDIDALMSFMSDDCVFETVGGPEPVSYTHLSPGTWRRTRTARRWAGRRQSG